MSVAASSSSVRCASCERSEHGERAELARSAWGRCATGQHMFCAHCTAGAEENAPGVLRTACPCCARDGGLRAAALRKAGLAGTGALATRESWTEEDSRLLLEAAGELREHMNRLARRHSEPGRSLHERKLEAVPEWCRIMYGGARAVRDVDDDGVALWTCDCTKDLRDRAGLWSEAEGAPSELESAEALLGRLLAQLPSVDDLRLPQLDDIALVSNGDVLRGSGLGPQIDSHGTVLRFNAYKLREEDKSNQFAGRAVPMVEDGEDYTPDIGSRATVHYAHSACSASIASKRQWSEHSLSVWSGMMGSQGDRDGERVPDIQGTRRRDGGRLCGEWFTVYGTYATMGAVARRAVEGSSVGDPGFVRSEYTAYTVVFDKLVLRDRPSVDGHPVGIVGRGGSVVANGRLGDWVRVANSWGWDAAYGFHERWALTTHDRYGTLLERAASQAPAAEAAARASASALADPFDETGSPRHFLRSVVVLRPSFYKHHQAFVRAGVTTGFVGMLFALGCRSAAGEEDELPAVSMYGFSDGDQSLVDARLEEQKERLAEAEDLHGTGKPRAKQGNPLIAHRGGHYFDPLFVMQDHPIGFERLAMRVLHFAGRIATTPAP